MQISSPAWKHALALRFREGLEDVEPVSTLPPGVAVSLHAFLHSVDVDMPSSAHQQILERLSKKVEVVRKVHDLYDQQWRVHKAAQEAGPQVMAALYRLFALIGIACQDMKWVNTALKMSDDICGVDWQKDPDVRDGLLGFLAERT